MVRIWFWLVKHIIICFEICVVIDTVQYTNKCYVILKHPAQDAINLKHLVLKEATVLLKSLCSDFSIVTNIDKFTKIYCRTVGYT